MIEIVDPITDVFLHSLIIDLMRFTLSRSTGIQKRMPCKLRHEVQGFIAIRGIANETSQNTMFSKSGSKSIAKTSCNKPSVNGLHFMLNMREKLTEPNAKLMSWT